MIHVSGMGLITFGKQADEKMPMRILDPSFEAGINSDDTAENYPVPPAPQWAGVQASDVSIPTAFGPPCPGLDRSIL